MTDKQLQQIYSAYFPYDLEMAYVVRDSVEKIGILKTIDYNESETHPLRLGIENMYDMEHEWMFKPFLRDMKVFEEYFAKLFDTDIDVRTFLNEGFITEENQFESISDMINNYKVEWWPYGAVQLALKHHFNIFYLPKERYIYYEDNR